MYEDNTVVDTMTDITPDDAGQGQPTELDEQQGQISEKLREFIGEVDEDDEQEKANPEPAPEEPKREPGWLKMRLEDEKRKGDKAGYERGRQEIESYKAQLAEMQAKLDRYADIELEQEAKEIAVKEGCSVDFAKRLLRAERGVKPPIQTAPTADKGQKEQAKTPARDEHGRFVAAEQNAEPSKDTYEAEAQRLYDEAKLVEKATGVDVLKLYAENPEVQKRVLSRGDDHWDFGDVAREYMKEVGHAKRTPQPVRSGGTNERGTGSIDFANMTRKQYEAFNRKIDEGYEYRP